ncbi:MULTISPECIES: alpha/beta hydrolase [unclassified Sphingomonas]|uniref:alpha/beta hydrolase n=1 Tax=unclassified Sphingomonas TaxID=196159 RepID=UPI00226A5577|nr:MULTISPECIES: alpha/beta hydrolase [unclassified Sphingomonas]
MRGWVIPLLAWSTAIPATANLPQSRDRDQHERPTTAIEYDDPKDAIVLSDKRRVHLVCRGSGSPTVILTAGIGNWSEVWGKVQPALAQRNKVCAWDRAGFGFSDASKIAQTTSATTDDLENALHAAHVVGPYILVGHSMGSYESLMFADRHLADVAGMVLVDPSIPNQFQRLAVAAPSDEAQLEQQNDAIVQGSRKCATALRTGQLTLTSPDPDGCLQYSPRYSKRLKDELAKRDLNPARFDTTASLFSEFPSNARAVEKPRRNYNDIPLIILSAFVPSGNNSDHQQPANVVSPLQREWLTAHRDLMHVSRAGTQWEVPGAGHFIQLSNPDAVIGAVDAVIDAADQNSAPK